MPKTRAPLAIALWFLVAVLVLAPVGRTAFAESSQAAPALTTHTCNGTLVVLSNVWNSSLNPVYRLSGSGPGLPAQKTVPAWAWTTVTFSLPGPGTWSGLTLEYSEGGVGPWIVSGYAVNVTCVAPSNVDVQTAGVGGIFITDAPVYWAPGEPTEPLITIKAGNTTRVRRADATGMYYEIIWQDQFLWVPANTLAPNPDAVWKGAPLPARTPIREIPTTYYPTSTTATTGVYVYTGTAAGYPVFGAPKTASSYVVQRGDNLFRIALHFGVDLYRLASVNGITNIQRIYAGQVLNIAAAR